jgi:hypothetical protein
LAVQLGVDSERPASRSTRARHLRGVLEKTGGTDDGEAASRAVGSRFVEQLRSRPGGVASGQEGQGSLGANVDLLDERKGDARVAEVEEQRKELGRVGQASRVEAEAREAR